NATMPYIIYGVQGGGSTNTTPRDDLDVLETVKCVASSAAKARVVSELIRAALHRQQDDVTMDDGWRWYWLSPAQIVSYVENAERLQIYHEGATYRIRAAK